MVDLGTARYPVWRLALSSHLRGKAPMSPAPVKFRAYVRSPATRLPRWGRHPPTDRRGRRVAFPRSCDHRTRRRASSGSGESGSPPAPMRVGVEAEHQILYASSQVTKSADRAPSEARSCACRAGPLLAPGRSPAPTRAVTPPRPSTLPRPVRCRPGHTARAQSRAAGRAPRCPPVVGPARRARTVAGTTA